MNWVTRTFLTSVGKKQLMALTGLGFVGFVVAHLLGNLSIYLGPEAFTSYAEHLHALGPLIRVAEMGMLVFFIIHVTTGLTLFYQNWQARSRRYIKKAWAGGRTLGSSTMPFTGIFLFFFVMVHLSTFRFVPHSTDQTFHLARAVFSQPAYFFFYTLSMVVLGLHVRHGFWSAFQTLGANHPKYMPAIEALAIFLGVAAALGFGFLPTIFIVV